MKMPRILHRHMKWFNIQPSRKTFKVWISYDEAFKIIPRPMQWYQDMRMGHIDDNNVFNPPVLKEGIDWRRFGFSIEYSYGSIRRLEDQLFKTEIGYT